MSVKRIRCICGTIYDPAKQPACPSCGEPYKPVAITPPSPPAVAPTEPAAPIVKEEAPPRLRPAGDPWVAVQRLLRSSGEQWRQLSPELRRNIMLGAGAVVVLVLVLRAFGGSDSRTEKRTNAENTHRAEPGPTASPERATPREWVVDASNATGENDLATAIASAGAGDTITLRPGIYRGGFTLERPVMIHGSPDAPNGTVLQSDERPVIDVRAQGVVVANVMLTAGDRTAVAVTLSPGATAEFTDCQVHGSAQTAVLVSRAATLKGLRAVFSAPAGTALRIEGQGRASLDGCTVSDSRDGVAIAAGAEADVANSVFQGNAIGSARSSIATVMGKGASLAINASRFLANGAGINALDGATVTIVDSFFQGNGEIGGESDARGLISVAGGATGSVMGSTFEQNGYGLAAAGGGTLEIERCLLESNTGFAPAYGQSAPLHTIPVSATGTGSRVALRQSAIVRHGSQAVQALAGATIVIEDSEIGDSHASGVIVGDRGGPPAQVQITRSFLRRNDGNGVWVRAGSSASIEATEFTENGTGILVTEAGSRVTLTNFAAVGNRDYGIHTHTGGEVTATGGTFDDNARSAQSGLQNKSAAHATLTLDGCTIRGSRVYALGVCAQSVLTANNCTFEENADLLYRERTAVVHGVTEAGVAEDESAEETPRRSTSRERSATRAPTPRRTSESQNIRDAVERVRRNFRRHFP
jgi:hypothetical protein